MKPTTSCLLRIFHKIEASKNYLIVMLSTGGIARIIRMLFYFYNHNIDAAFFFCSSGTENGQCQLGRTV